MQALIHDEHEVPSLFLIREAMYLDLKHTPFPINKLEWWLNDGFYWAVPNKCLIYCLNCKLVQVSISGKTMLTFQNQFLLFHRKLMYKGLILLQMFSLYHSLMMFIVFKYFIVYKYSTRHSTIGEERWVKLVLWRED